MTVRPRRLFGLAPVAALLAFTFVLGSSAWCQPAPGKDTPTAPSTKDSPPTEPASPAGQGATPAPPPTANVTVQTGLPVELRVDPKRLDDEQQALESALVYIHNNQPSGNIVARAGRSIIGFFSGKSKPRAVTPDAIATSGGQMNGKLISVEGLCRVKKDGAQLLVAGDSEVKLTQLPHTVVQGFPNNKPDGMPAQVEGIVIVGQQGPVINVNQMTPAPSLTLVRLARCHELRDTAADYQQAVQLYDEVSNKSTAEPWSGFAMAHGGRIAADIVRDRKRAIALYNKAWELEGRTKGPPGTVGPQTWVQQANGLWEAEGLREAVAKPLDALNNQGFWYKFVDTFVIICGGNAGLGLILLAIFTRLLLYPLTKKQIHSAREMQKLQPQIKALQEKHGADKKKFNEEFWKVCRENKVNPLGGCLPLVIQMPLLIFVYRGIQAYVVQLGTHHFLWIPSLADPNMPLLVLYTVSMIAFQKLTMATQPIADPKQQQQQNMMVWMMPLMFFMFFQTLPSGFILYWLGTNLIYIPQQYFGTRIKKDQEGEKNGAGGERTVTLETRSASGNPTSTQPQGALDWLKGLIVGKPKAAAGEPPPSYEEKKLAEKRKQRRPTRRRRRP